MHIFISLPAVSSAQIKAAEAVREKCIEMFGGCTEVMGMGYWKKYVERVMVLNVFVLDLSHATHRRLREALSVYMNSVGEECVFYALDGKPNFINAGE